MEEETKHTTTVRREGSRDLALKVLAGLGAVFAILIAVGLLSAAVFHAGFGGYRAYGPMHDERYGGSLMHGRGGYGMGWMMDDDEYGHANEQRLSGVVTVVNGDTFTIAGGGTTNTVKTDSNTRYDGGDKPAVNDTVVVYGATENGTFTATDVSVR